MGDAKPDDDNLLAGVFAIVGTGDEETGIWPTNMMATVIFSDMLTQWQVGFNGVVGLRYESLPVVIGARKIKAEEKPDIFEAIKIMERSALKEINERKS